MKNIFLIAAAFMLSATIVDAQSKLSIDKVYTAYLRNSGTILENNQVKGYFFLYQSDKIDRQTNEYTLQILDQNLNKVKDLIFKDTKKLSLLEASYNGSSIGFLFKNDDTRTLDMKIYGVDGSLKYSYSREINKRTEQVFKMHEMMKLINEEAAMTRNSYNLGKNGYATLYPIKDGHQSTYELNFYSATEKREWTYNPEDEERYAMAEFLGSTDNQIILEVMKKSKTFSGKLTSHIVGINMLTGKKEFDIDNEKDEYTIVPSGIASVAGKNEIIIMGSYFDKNANVVKDFSKGLAVYSIDTKGNVINKSYSSWLNDFGKFVPVSKKGKIENVGYLFIHKMIQAADGKMFAVGEGYKRQAAKLSITDMVVIEFDNQHKLTKANIYDKTSNTPVDFPQNGFENQHALALELNTFGYFDYEFTTGEADNSTFSICYTEHQKNKENQGGTFNSIRYNGTEFTTDKIELKSKASIMKVFPAKAGSIMVMEYFKKEKRLDFRLEKLS